MENVTVEFEIATEAKPTLQSFFDELKEKEQSMVDSKKAYIKAMVPITQALKKDVHLPEIETLMPTWPPASKGRADTRPIA